MSRRTDLQAILERTLGSKNVYFQPPANVCMKYPAIVYSLSGIDPLDADDAEYLQPRAYEVTLIDKNPDSLTIGKLSKLPYTRFNRHYTADNLNHDVFTLYY